MTIQGLSMVTDRGNGRQALAKGFFLPFQWQDRFLTGHPTIDADHRRFFDFFAEVAERPEGLANTPANRALFHGIAADLEGHLVSEEVILEQIGYPDLVEHRHSHRALREQVKAALVIGDMGEWLTAVWLLSMAVLEHVALEDVGIRDYLEAGPQRPC